MRECVPDVLGGGGGIAALILLSLTSAGLAAPIYEATELPLTVAYDINNSGQVVGFDGNYNGYTPQHAAIWENGVKTWIFSDPDLYSIATGINNLGQVVGQYRVQKAGGGGFRSQPFLWSKSTGPIDLPFWIDPDVSMYAWDINDAGVVIGSSQQPNSWDERQFAYSSSAGFVELAGLGYRPTDINNAGLITFGNSANGWIDRSDGSLVTYLTGQAMAINDGGYAAGMVWANGVITPALWSPVDSYASTTMFPQWHAEDYIYGINASLQMVGKSGNWPRYSATLYDGTRPDQGPLDLFAATAPGSGFASFQDAVGINDLGWIIGYGVGGASMQGANSAYLLRPIPTAVPEPGTLSVLAVGGVILARRRRQRSACTG